MVKKTKRFKEILEKVDTRRTYTIKEAVETLKEIPHPKFDETVEVSCKLNVDPKKSDQMVRGSVVLPHGLGKDIKVLVFTKGEKEKEAKAAGADYVGSEELISKIQGGWLGFDVAIATPDMMREVGKLGKILGPRGLMPSPKVGTVTDQLQKAIKEAKAGKLDFKVDRTGVVNVGIGKISFPVEHLIENINTFLDALYRAKPASARGQYIKKMAVSTTMGPGLKIDLGEVTR
ncbi:MAG: 50S ribosomal protein L1 [Candidatus Omnitrophica bacterium 4484_49]|nr:50S ribosomal protein L1 [Candidatus Omnitrophota bacterium]OQX83561.1 MAG: 50S ribosomal protein L1 [Candidatus Omnitrophica bacterium 4484_49]